MVFLLYLCFICWQILLYFFRSETFFVAYNAVVVLSLYFKKHPSDECRNTGKVVVLLIVTVLLYKLVSFT